jgi:quercetin dioxygenase-like cupin family protein
MVNQAFENALRREGFGEIEIGEKPANHRTGEHAHGFDVSALVLDGAITLICDGRARTYAAGDRFDMAAGKPHVEAVGPQGVRYVVGRRR